MRDELGRRPTASELLVRGILPKTLSKKEGSWFAFVASEGDMTSAEQQALDAFLPWLKTLETTSLNKSYKMVVLRVLLDQNQLFEPVDLDKFAQQCRSFMRNHPVLRRDLEGDGHAVDHHAADQKNWTEWWIKWPINRWLDTQNGQKWFKRVVDDFQLTIDCTESLRPTLESLTEELVDWRLAAYSKTHRLAESEVGELAFEAKVSHAGGRPILFLPDKTTNPDRPVGPVNVQLPDGTTWEFKFVKVACNVAKPLGGTKNELGQLLKTWFGPNAGLPGTDFKVHFSTQQGQWHAQPTGIPHAVSSNSPLPSLRSGFPGGEGKGEGASVLRPDGFVQPTCIAKGNERSSPDRNRSVPLRKIQNARTRVRSHRRCW